MFRRCDSQGARAVRATVALIHRDAYADAIASGDPFESHETFMQRFDAHTRHPSLDLVIAYIGDEPVGQIWGWPEPLNDAVAQPATAGEPEPGLADESGKGTFSLAEIMVRQAWTGHGIAHALHNQLLVARTEGSAELYVRHTMSRRPCLPEMGAAQGRRNGGQIWPDAPVLMFSSFCCRSRGDELADGAPASASPGGSTAEPSKAAQVEVSVSWGYSGGL